MLKAEQVPKEAADALQELISRGVFISTEEAIAAAINAWPGMEKLYRQPHRLAVDYSHPEIILPLPQEARDD